MGALSAGRSGLFDSTLVRTLTIIFFLRGRVILVPDWKGIGKDMTHLELDFSGLLGASRLVVNLVVGISMAVLFDILELEAARAAEKEGTYGCCYVSSNCYSPAGS